MNTFIQWQETISDAYLTDTPPYFPFIELNISLSPRKSRKHTKQRFDYATNGTVDSLSPSYLYPICNKPKGNIILLSPLELKSDFISIEAP